MNGIDNKFDTAAQLLQEHNKMINYIGNGHLVPQGTAKELISTTSSFLTGGLQSTDQDGTAINEDSLLIGEARRKLIGHNSLLYAELTGEPLSMGQITKLFGIQNDDVSGLHDWLVDPQNKADIETAVENQYQETPDTGRNYGISSDVKQDSQDAFNFSANHIDTYHRVLGLLLAQEVKGGSKIGLVKATPTAVARSYFMPNRVRTAIGVDAITYVDENGKLNLRPRALLELTGHESWGHGLNQVTTNESDLPDFMKVTSQFTLAAQESVAQLIQKWPLRFLKDSPEIQKQLKITEELPKIEAEIKDADLINEYERNFFYNALMVLADSTLMQEGETIYHQAVIERKIEALAPTALYPSLAVNFVQSNVHNYLPNGYLRFSPANEIRYAAKPADRVREEYIKHGIDVDAKGAGRDHFFETIMTGFWTPEGMEQRGKMRVAQFLEENKQD